MTEVPQAPVTEESDSAVRSMQLTTAQEQPFAKPFLMWMYAEFLDDVFSHLPQEYHREVDALLMLNTYVMRADLNPLMTGLS